MTQFRELRELRRRQLSESSKAESLSGAVTVGFCSPLSHVQEAYRYLARRTNIDPMRSCPVLVGVFEDSSHGLFTLVCNRPCNNSVSQVERSPLIPMKSVV